MKIIINFEDEDLDHLLKRIVVVRQFIEDTKTSSSKEVGFSSKEIYALCKETKSGFSIKYWKKD